MHSPEGGAPEGVSLRVCSQTSGECTSTETSPYYVNNSLFISLLVSHFTKKINYIGTWECGNIKNWGRSQWRNALGLLLGQIPQNTHRNKRELFTIGQNLRSYTYTYK